MMKILSVLISTPSDKTDSIFKIQTHTSRIVFISHIAFAVVSALLIES